MQRFSSRHFLTGEELDRTELLTLLETAEQMRLDRDTPPKDLPLFRRTVGLMFEKPSLRTRVSFTVGVQELGGFALELLSSQLKSEEPQDTIRVLERMIHALMLRTFSHSTLERMAAVSTIPVINGLSDQHHPCQALADLLTLGQTFGNLSGVKLAYLGDGNNVLHSLLLLAPLLGVNVNYCCPTRYQPDPEILKRALTRAKSADAQIRSFTQPRDAVAGVQAVYTDTWASMGKEHENPERRQAFTGFQLNQQLFALAAPNAIAMHCLPMQREQEITSEVVEHSRSALFRQAENRLHTQKALLVGLMGGGPHGN